MISILFFLIILTLLIFVHELGHFSVAKFFGIKVEEFGLGFPPKLYSKKIGETIYSINMIPFGGFVKMAGEDEIEGSGLTDETKGRRLPDKSKRIQAAVLAAGVVFNLLFAWIVLSIGLIIGWPMSLAGLSENFEILETGPVVIQQVVSDSPADKAGLMAGQEIEAVILNNKKEDIQQAEELSLLIEQMEAKEIGLEVLSTTGEKQSIVLEPTTGFRPNGKRALGVELNQIGLVKTVWWQAPVVGLKMIFSLTILILQSLFEILSGIFVGQSPFDQLIGPVGLAGLVGETSSMGFIYVASLIVLISINLAIINFIPFPALDGGRLFILALEAIRKKEFNQAVISWFNLVGFVLLIALMVYLTVDELFILLFR
ncbi:MAG: M50 family metallopeptidase [Patescibacteria group bacterium]